MSVDTHFDIYMVKKGRWSQHERLTANQEQYAHKLANHLETQVQVPVKVIKEQYDTVGDVTHAGLVRDTQYIIETVKPPEQTDLTTRFVLVGLNSIGTGAVLAAILFMVIVFARGAGIDVPPNAVSFFMLIGFAIGFLSGAWIMFRVFVPQDLLRWMAKSDQARSGAIYLLTGEGNAPPALDAFEPQEADSQSSDHQTVASEEAPDLGEDGFETASDTAGTAEAGADQGADPGEDLKAAALAALLGEKVKELSAFATIANGLLLEEFGELEPFVKFGLNLYLAGAADGLTEQDDLSPEYKAALLVPVLEAVGTSTELAVSFVERLPASAERPRFKTVMEAGWSGLQSMQATGELPVDLLDVFAAWSDPEARAEPPVEVPFMVTDIVGSTKLTQKFGDAKAQKLIRTHNSIVRSAVRDGGGDEIKHTGDGIIAKFDSPEAMIDAAIQVQQLVFDHNREETELPLEVRIGVHLGEAVLEEGEYFGIGLNMADAICGAANEGEIWTSNAVREACPDRADDFKELEATSLKGMKNQHDLFQIKWEPNFRYRKTEVKYQQIGSLNA